MCTMLKDTSEDNFSCFPNSNPLSTAAITSSVRVKCSQSYSKILNNTYWYLHFSNMQQKFPYWSHFVWFKAELIITFSHRSNDRAITTRDCPLIVPSGQVWPVINVPVEMSFFVSPTARQRRVSDRSQRQRLKNGEKGSKWSIRHYRGCDVTSMPKEPTWSPSTALYEGSTKPTYDRSKSTGEIGSRVRQTREQATWSRY